MENFEMVLRMVMGLRLILMSIQDMLVHFLWERKQVILKFKDKNKIIRVIYYMEFIKEKEN